MWAFLFFDHIVHSHALTPLDKQAKIMPILRTMERETDLSLSAIGKAPGNCPLRLTHNLSSLSFFLVCPLIKHLVYVIVHPYHYKVNKIL